MNEVSSETAIEQTANWITPLAMSAVDHLMRNPRGSNRYEIQTFSQDPKLNGITQHARADCILSITLTGSNKFDFLLFSSERDLEHFLQICNENDTFVPALLVEGSENVKHLAYLMHNQIKRAMKARTHKRRVRHGRNHSRQHRFSGWQQFVHQPA